MASFGTFLGAGLGAAIGFLAAPATGGASLALASAALGGLSGGLAGKSADQSRKSGREGRRALESERQATAQDRQRLEAENRRLDNLRKRESDRLESARIRGIRGRSRRPGFLADSGDSGERSVLG